MRAVELRITTTPWQHMEKLLEDLSAARIAEKAFVFPLATAVAPPVVSVSPSSAVEGWSRNYSGIESYYEQAGHELARLGHDVTVYCRSYFTPAMTTRNGIRAAP